MADFEELRFVIPGYTPETIPLDRLIRYLEEIHIIIGEPDNLHLVEIQNGSVVPVFHAPATVINEARAHAIRVKCGKGSRQQLDAYNRVRHMVRQDAPNAEIPAVLMSADKVVLEIPAAPDDSGIFLGIWQVTTIDGQLIGIKDTGEGEYAIAQIENLQGETISGLMVDRAVAKGLFRWLGREPVRLTGIGCWDRTEEGEWRLKRMQVQSYEVLTGENVGLVLERLRKLKVKWPEDALDRLREEREDSTS